jgi:hypothetical protein
LSKKKAVGTFILNDRETDVFSWSSMIVANKLNCKLMKIRRKHDIQRTFWLEICNESTKNNKLIPGIESFLRSKHINHVRGLIENDMNIVERKIADACVRQLNFSSSCSDSENELDIVHVNESTNHMYNSNDSDDSEASENVLLENTLKDDIFESTGIMLEYEFPYLSKHNIPFNRKELVSLTAELVKLNEMLKGRDEEEIFKSQYHNNQALTVVCVPQSHNYERFKRNCKDVGWVQDMVKFSYWGKDSNSDIGAFWIMKYLSSMYRDMFLQVVSHVKIPIIKHKMDAVSALAMWSAANVSTSQQRIIQRHIHAALGFRLIVPESKVTQMKKDRYV